MAKSLLAVTLTCPKLNNNNVTKVILPIEHTQTIYSVYLAVHKDVPCEYSARCSTAIEADGFQIFKEMTLADLKTVADMRAVAFHCAMEPGKNPSTYESGKHPAAAVANAFQILMDGEKVKIKMKSTCHNRKDELYNDVVKLMVQRNLKMHKSSVADEGEYIVQVITNALWCLTNHHLTINDAAKTSRDAIPVPELFAQFQGFNDLKRKKLKSQPIQQAECDSHANALVNIITRPIFHSDVHWQQFKEEVECLAKCLVHYKMYLENKLKSQTHRHDQLNPPRTVGNDISLEFRAKTPFVYEKYKLFDEEVKRCDFLKPILFDESVHLASPFENRMQMKRFFDELSLSVDVDLYRYCQGGGVSNIMFVAKVPSNRSANDAHIQPVRVIAQINNKLPEYHTRAMKREFRQKISLIAKIQPGILDFVYKELALDASDASNPESTERKDTQKPKGNLRSAPLSVQRNADEPTHDASIFTAQNARSITECCECRKPRVIYTKHKLTERQLVQVSLQLSEFDYTRGSYIPAPANKLHGVVHVRTQLSCKDPIELAFYSSEVGRKDLSCFCATPQADISAELKKQFKTIYLYAPSVWLQEGNQYVSGHTRMDLISLRISKWYTSSKNTKFKILFIVDTVRVLVLFFYCLYKKCY